MNKEEYEKKLSRDSKILGLVVLVLLIAGVYFIGPQCVVDPMPLRNGKTHKAK